jgi:hypothetical protein
MQIERALLEEAEYAAKGIRGAAAALEPELREIEQRKLEIEAVREAAALAPKRLLKFQPKIGTEYQCPRCWIGDERRSALTAIPGDVMRCHTCGGDFIIPSE